MSVQERRRMTFNARKTLRETEGQSHSQIHNIAEQLISGSLAHCHHFLKTVLKSAHSFLNYFGNSQMNGHTVT